MKRFSKVLLLSAAATAALLGSPTKEEVAHMKKIVGYFPEWGIYSGHNNYLPADVPMDKVTHINYAFATIKNGVIAHFDTYAATEASHGEAWDSPYKGNLGQFEKLKAAYPHLSVLVSVGGWTQSGNFHDVAATQASREKFARSVVQYLRTYHFDGVDIDWEYPGSYREPDLNDNPNDQGTPKADASEKETFTLLLKTLREFLDKAGQEDGKYYQLTAALSASPQVIDFIEPSKFARYLDFFNLMTYDMHGAWDAKTNHQSALYPNPKAPDALNVDSVVKKYLSYGVPKDKLVIGTPFYSRGWKGVAYTKLENGLEGLFASAQGGAHGVWDGGVAGGMNPYYEIVRMEQDPSFTKYFDEDAKATYLYSKDKGEFYTYEDKRSLQAKVDYVKRQGLGGMIIWELSADVRNDPEHSLLDVIYRGFYPNGIDVESSGEGDTTDPDDNATQVGNDSSDTGTGDATNGSDEGVNDGGSSSDTAEAWDASKVYTGGEIVTYKSIRYKAKWWTQGDVPGADEWGPWEALDSGNADQNGSGAQEGGDSGTGDATQSGQGSDGQNGDSSTTDDTNQTQTTDGIVSLQDLQAQEKALTDTPQMLLVKASIRTISNDEVAKIAPGRADNPTNVKRVESIVSAQTWDYLFPMRAPEYTYENFLKAVGKFPAFCGDYDDGRDAEAICRKALATMFAHFTQETGGHTAGTEIPQWRQGLVFVREAGWDETMRGGYNAECSLDTWQGKRFPCGTFEDGSFKSYFGRGAKQLSYNYNYGPFSEAMTGDVHTLLDHPELVADTWYNLASAVFFFVYPQPPKPSMLHVVDGTWQPNAVDKASGLYPGFGATINIINGGVECGGSVETQQAQNCIAYYKAFAEYLGVPVAQDEVLGCSRMGRFSSDGAGALPIYWEEDWSWNPDTPDGRSYRCRLVNYQTPYSALKEGDYVRCVEEKFNVTAQ